MTAPSCSCGQTPCRRWRQLLGSCPGPTEPGRSPSLVEVIAQALCDSENVWIEGDVDVLAAEIAAAIERAAPARLSSDEPT